MKVDNILCSTYTIGTEGYKCKNDLENIIPMKVDKQLENIDCNRIDHIDEHIIRNKIIKTKTIGVIQPM